MIEPRAVLKERMPCLPHRRHTFTPDGTICLCGALGRASTSEFPEVFAIWPNAADEDEGPTDG
jgi:hypothetical protein